MARRGLSIAAKLTVATSAPVALAAAVFALLASVEVDRARAVADPGLAPDARAALDAAAHDRLRLRLIGAGVACVVAAGVVGWLQGRALVRRLGRVTAASEAFVAGRATGKVADGAGPADELGVLATSIDFMTEHLSTVVGRAREKAKRSAEAEVAHAIQGALLPPSGELERPGLRLAGGLRATEACGGDFWGAYALDDDRTLVVIGGATGHGVDATMVAAAARSAADAIRTARGGALSPAEVLEAMNAAVFQQSRRRQLLTCFASVIDVRQRSIVHANAGHPFTYLYRRGRDEPEFSTLTSRGNRLGEVREARYETAWAALASGDTLIWYTEGVVQCDNASGEALGDKRFRAMIRRAAEADVAAARDRMMGECFAFYGAIPPKDDITMVIGRVTTS